MRLRPAVVVALFVAGASVATGQQPPPGARPGVDLTGADRRVRPQDDLYRFANGGWLDTTDIPSERTTYGTFAELSDRTEADLRAIIEDLQREPKRKTGSVEQLVVDLYASAMNEARVDALGDAPIRPMLTDFAAIATPGDVATMAGRLTALGAGGPFAVNVVIDANDPSRLIGQATQGGILLPNRDYYVLDQPLYVEARRKYIEYLQTIFALAGRADAAALARTTFDFERHLADAQLPVVDSRNEARTMADTTLADLAERYPGFDWSAWAKPQGLHRTARVVLMQPTFFTAFAAVFATTPTNTLRGWLLSRYLTAMAPYLSRPYVDARFSFFGTVLTGQQQPRARWKVAVGTVSSFLGDAIGRVYVQRHFPPSAQQRARRIVTFVLRAYRDAIAHADWLSRSTRTEALLKLTRLTPRVGYPDQWRDYSRLVITPDDLFGNIQRARTFDGEFRLARSRGYDGGEWPVAAQTVNAFYNPGLNQLYLPAAILQAPHFDADADDAVNFGAVGATIGHELTHAFDERGRRYDASGDVRRWWTVEEEREFLRRERSVVEQFNAYVPIDRLHVDGDLTRYENLADIVGLSIAWRAYQLALDGKPAPVIDGFSGEQRFFLSYARMWRTKVRDDYLRQWLVTLPYAPYEYRTNGVVSHVDAFHDAFATTPGDALFRAAEKRIKIW